MQGGCQMPDVAGDLELYRALPLYKVFVVLLMANGLLLGYGKQERSRDQIRAIRQM